MLNYPTPQPTVEAFSSTKSSLTWLPLFPTAGPSTSTATPGTEILYPNPSKSWIIYLTDPSLFKNPVQLAAKQQQQQRRQEQQSQQEAQCSTKILSARSTRNRVLKPLDSRLLSHYHQWGEPTKDHLGVDQRKKQKKRRRGVGRRKKMKLSDPLEWMERDGTRGIDGQRGYFSGSSYLGHFFNDAPVFHQKKNPFL